MCLLFSAAKVKHFSEITNKKKDFLRYLLKLVRNNGKNEEKCIIGRKPCHEDIVDGASQLMDVPFMDSPSPLDERGMAPIYNNMCNFIPLFC